MPSLNPRKKCSDPHRAFSVTTFARAATAAASAVVVAALPTSEQQRQQQFDVPQPDVSSTASSRVYHNNNLSFLSLDHWSGKTSNVLVLRNDDTCASMPSSEPPASSPSSLSSMSLSDDSSEEALQPAAPNKKHLKVRVKTAVNNSLRVQRTKSGTFDITVAPRKKRRNGRSSPADAATSSSPSKSSKHSKRRSSRRSRSSSAPALTPHTKERFDSTSQSDSHPVLASEEVVSQGGAVPGPLSGRSRSSRRKRSTTTSTVTSTTSGVSAPGQQQPSAVVQQGASLPSTAAMVAALPVAFATMSNATLKEAEQNAERAVVSTSGRHSVNSAQLAGDPNASRSIEGGGGSTFSTTESALDSFEADVSGDQVGSEHAAASASENDACSSAANTDLDSTFSTCPPTGSSESVSSSRGGESTAAVVLASTNLPSAAHRLTAGAVDEGEGVAVVPEGNNNNAEEGDNKDSSPGAWVLWAIIGCVAAVVVLTAVAVMASKNKKDDVTGQLEGKKEEGEKDRGVKKSSSGGTRKQTSGSGKKETAAVRSTPKSASEARNGSGNSENKPTGAAAPTKGTTEGSADDAAAAAAIVPRAAPVVSSVSSPESGGRSTAGATTGVESAAGGVTSTPTGTNRSAVVAPLSLAALSAAAATETEGGSTDSTAPAAAGEEEEDVPTIEIAISRTRVSSGQRRTATGA